MTSKKIDLNKLSKANNRPRISKEEREELLKTKGDEMAGKQKEAVFTEPKIVVETSSKATHDELTRLLEKLPEANRFIEGIRQQSSINTSDYTNCLIDILIEAKKREGEKIKKTSYLEKYIVQGVKKELLELGIEIK